MATLTRPQRATARSYQVLDPRTMGRPVHLLGRYTDRLRKDLLNLFHVWFNRRYRAQFDIGTLAFEPAPAHVARRWINFGADTGRMAFAADRNVLLCVLAYRYGVPPSDVPAVNDASEDSSERETATEERLAGRIGKQLLGAAAAAIEALQPDATEAQLTQEFTPVVAGLNDAAWTLRVNVTERAHRLNGSLWFRFDEAWIARLMRGLAPNRERTKTQTSSASSPPLPTRLQLTLQARMVDKPIDLGTLLDLRVGDIIPVTLDSTDVLIGESRLFTASVAEHKGKLCLTCFKDVE